MFCQVPCVLFVLSWEYPYALGAGDKLMFAVQKSHHTVFPGDFSDRLDITI